MNIVVLGPPGSGKSVQAKIIAAKTGTALLNVGELLRRLVKGRGSKQKALQALIQKGRLVGNRTLAGLLTQELSKGKYKKGVVLDGAPRTINQARFLKKMLPIAKVFYLEVGKTEAVRRLLKRGRGDDTTEIIESRFKTYRIKTAPLIKFYQEEGVLVRVDATPSIQKIFSSIRKSL